MENNKYKNKKILLNNKKGLNDLEYINMFNKYINNNYYYIENNNKIIINNINILNNIILNNVIIKLNKNNNNIIIYNYVENYLYNDNNFSLEYELVLYKL